VGFESLNLVSEILGASKNLPSIVTKPIAQGILGENPKMCETLSTGNLLPAV
jgi:hypothetical protein